MLFRISLIALALLVGCYGLLSGAAELAAAARPVLPADPKAPAQLGEAPSWPGGIPFFRSDLENNHALIEALHAIRDGKASADSDHARSRAISALSVKPYDAELWLTLALLETRRDPNGPTVVGALKMAYITGANDARLMPLRLYTATSADALFDLELAELARGDVRLILTRRPELKATLVQAYRRASKQGKSFLEEAVQAVDAPFLGALRS
ncbi:hypothetical protein UB31_36250 [Bradyrhizobium sp. LTSP849]|uniref:hypothetical protein n=1 Tax=Bradyrhizobium sp. LTSP849 TaxID=1615890 RepID=UPI0005D284A2|nr:hypothetical protein [Bradyrhizobium sp. LTSP849]KJC36265.1 hypothetical protein UB31_36250 [Bradyrhizobium sp. LTSP849]